MHRGLLITGSLVVVLGMAGAAVWIYLSHHEVEPVVNSSGGSIVLDGGSSPAPSTLSENKTQTKGVPLMEKDDFSTYEQYKDQTNALYFDETAGTGAVVEAGKTVTVNYRGWLTNGTIFDESYKRNQPFSFKVGSRQVISGWDNGLIGMKVGGKRRLVVPPAAGYGANPTGPIPANSVLVFDIELLDVK